MEERNPLEIHTSETLPKKSLQSNKRGRPSLSRAINFSSQPKSMISQLLNKVREKSCDNVKDEMHLIEVMRNIPSSKPSISNISNQMNLESEIEPLVNSYEDIQRSFTFDLNSPEHSHDSLKDIYSLNNNEQNSYETNTHHDEKYKSDSNVPEITCYVCSHRSSSHKAHRKHLSIHRNQPYNCDFPECNYTCKLSSNLIKHKRIHTSEKPYLCDQCTFRSNFGNSLKVHKRTHTSERPYGCPYCSYRCNSSSNLKKHCLHRHREVS